MKWANAPTEARFQPRQRRKWSQPCVRDQSRYVVRMLDLNTNDPTQAPADGLAGRLLVAMPQLTGGAFARAVILMVRHDAHQAFGLILNRPLEGVTAGQVLKTIGLSPSITAGALAVNIGGPVEHQRGLILHTNDFSDDQTRAIPGGLALSGHRRALERLIGDRVQPSRSRLFIGYAGWARGQLESELRRQAWIDVDADIDFIFSTPADKMWAAAVSRLGLDERQLWMMAPNSVPTGYRSTQIN